MEISEQDKRLISDQLDMIEKIGLTEREFIAATEISIKMSLQMIRNVTMMDALLKIASSERIRRVLVAKAALALSLRALQDVPDEEGGDAK